MLVYSTPGPSADTLAGDLFTFSCRQFGGAYSDKSLVHASTGQLCSNGFKITTQSGPSSKLDRLLSLSLAERYPPSGQYVGGG
jgi:hypothetical protein